MRLYITNCRTIDYFALLDNIKGLLQNEGLTTQRTVLIDKLIVSKPVKISLLLHETGQLIIVFTTAPNFTCSETHKSKTRSRFIMFLRLILILFPSTTRFSMCFFLYHNPVNSYKPLLTCHMPCSPRFNNPVIFDQKYNHRTPNYTREQYFGTWKVYCVCNVTFHDEFKYTITIFQSPTVFFKLLFLLLIFRNLSYFLQWFFMREPIF